MDNTSKARIENRIAELQGEMERFMAMAPNEVEVRLQMLAQQMRMEVEMKLQSYQQRLADLQALLEDDEPTNNNTEEKG